MSLNGLRLQLALFYVLLSLPALLVIERAVFGWKFENMLMQLDDGRVERLLAREVVALDTARAAGARAEELELRLRNLVLRLERPRESLGTSAAFVLLELTSHPFEARLHSSDGRVVVAATAGPVETAGRTRSDWVRRAWTAPLPERSGHAPLHIELELAVPTPWKLSLEAVSFEWRLAVAYLLIFLLGSAWFLRWRVLGRVSSMVEAAGAWARGDFSVVLADRSTDELGRLAQALDRMATDVQALVGARARLASLEERQRLARDLHDTVKQKAFALSLQLGAARDSTTEAARDQRLTEAQALMSEIQHELAELLQDMRSSPQTAADDAARIDLVPAIQQRSDDFIRRSGLACTLTLPPALNVPAAVADVALRVLDEALTNVWRHAGAQTVRIGLTDVSLPGTPAAGFESMSILRQTPLRWRLQVEDDGRGFEGASKGGMGLNNMRERASSIAAHFGIERAPGGGTRVVLELPLSEPAR